MEQTRVRIILKAAPVHITSHDSQQMNVELKAPYREFQGCLKWSVVDGALILTQLLDEQQRDDFITFAAGEWTSIEKVALSVNTKQKDAAS